MRTYKEIKVGYIIRRETMFKILPLCLVLSNNSRDLIVYNLEEHCIEKMIKDCTPIYQIDIIRGI